MLSAMGLMIFGAFIIVGSVGLVTTGIVNVSVRKPLSEAAPKQTSNTTVVVPVVAVPRVAVSSQNQKYDINSVIKTL